jgi:ABC-type multidrug transport system fused ATPase/permease subunit
LLLLRCRVVGGDVHLVVPVGLELKHDALKDRHTSVLQDTLPDEKSVHLEFHDVTHFIQGRCVLNSVSGEALPKQILAIAGPSGAGEPMYKC